MSLTTQFATMISMILMGVFLGIFLDSYIILLRQKFISKVSKFINDIFFWLIYCIILFLVLFYINEGTLRFYVFLALALGFSIYKSLLETIYKTLLLKLIKIIQNIYRFLVKIFQKFILSPIKWIIMVLYKLINRIYTLIKSFIIKLLLLVYKVIRAITLFILNLIWAILPNRLKNYLMKVVVIIALYKNVKAKVIRYINKMKKAINKFRSWFKR